MVDLLQGKLVFEPHSMFGKPGFEGKAWPFGYISTDAPRGPIFELSVPLKWSEDGLRAVAMKMAAADDLLDALKLALDAANELGLSNADFPRVEIEAAIAKAEGRS